MPYCLGGVVAKLGDEYDGVILAQHLSSSIPVCSGEQVKIPPNIWSEALGKCRGPGLRQTYFSSGMPPFQQLGIHLMTNENFAAVVVTEAEITRRVGHGALDEMIQLFGKMYVEKPSQLTPAVCSGFGSRIKDILAKYSEGGEAETGDVKTRKVKKAVEEVKGIALNNIEKVLERQEKIDDVLERTEDLQTQAGEFQSRGRELNRKMWWNSTKGTIFIVGGLGIFLLLVIYIFCGSFTSCNPSGKSTTKS